MKNELIEINTEKCTVKIRLDNGFLFEADLKNIREVE